jgi:L,D-peptidoglycan transpeptidase YkuD (ErfK/YbiS/YcfS/YnhG family)
MARIRTITGCLSVILVLAVGIGCTSSSPTPVPAPNMTGQLIEVRGRHDDCHAKLACAERHGSSFEKVPGMQFECTVGKKGIVREGLKEEGDGRTPNGIYRISRAFGYGPTLETGLIYKSVTAEDIWIDDPKSPDYNLWKTKPTQAQSYEELKRDDDLYEFAAVIEYNTNPVMPGKGSAIFLHVWGGPDAPTAGCVALDRGNLIKLLKWLDVKKKPKIVIAYENSGMIEF